jgi:carbon monoxide dehydrogenase subunit G
MDMANSQRIEAPRETVWAAINDPEMLRKCLPGCEEIEKVSDSEMTAKVVLKIGPVKASFKGRVALQNVVAPESLTLAGEGTGGIAGHAKGSADVRLEEDGTATVLSYQVKAQIGGKIAQLGSRLIDSTAQKLAREFFSRLEAEIVGAPAPVR